jgi:hypothetical protein
VTRRSRVLRRRSSAPPWRGPSGELSSGRGSLPLRYCLSSLQFLLLDRMKIRIAVHSRTKACIAALSLSCRFAFPPCTISWTLCRCWYVSCARFLSFSKYQIFPFVSLIVPLPCRCALSPVLLLPRLAFRSLLVLQLYSCGWHQNEFPHWEFGRVGPPLVSVLPRRHHASLPQKKNQAQEIT